MKTLDEKKKLVAMMRAFGQPVDEELVESIRREEELSKKLFGEQKNIAESPLFEIVKEAFVSSVPTPSTPPAVEMPSKEELVQQVINVLDVNKANANTSIYRDKEIEGIRRTVAEIMQKISTMSWGGGGTGIVRLFDADDFDRATVGEGKFMKFSNGWFVLDDINPGEIVNNTTVVTTNTYTVVNTDYYIGVNYAGPVTITIPASISSGREVVIKDESGNCETNNITVNAKVDDDANGFILAINNGAVHMLYRGDSWRII